MLRLQNKTDNNMMFEVIADKYNYSISLQFLKGLQN